jgi:hypothetical protein
MTEASFITRLRDASINAVATVTVAAIALAAAVATGWFGLASKDQELKVHRVEIAIGILRADPKEDVAPARAWALDVIDRYSGVAFSAEDRASLLHKPIKSATYYMGPNTDFRKNIGVVESPDPVSAQDLWHIIVQMQGRLDRLDNKPAGENSLPPAPPKP